MRIGISISSSDGEIGSDARHVAATLQDRGNQVHIVRDAGLSFVSDASRNPPDQSAFWQQFKSMARLSRQLRRHRIQVLYLHAHFVTWSERIAARIARVPIVMGADAGGTLHREHLSIVSQHGATETVAGKLEEVFRVGVCQIFKT